MSILGDLITHGATFELGSLCPLVTWTDLLASQSYDSATLNDTNRRSVMFESRSTPWGSGKENAAIRSGMYIPKQKRHR